MSLLKAIATLDWSLDADCPHCNESVDIVVYDSGYYGIAKKIFENRWDAIKGHEITCPHCNKEFELEKVEY